MRFCWIFKVMCLRVKGFRFRVDFLESFVESGFVVGFVFFRMVREIWLVISLGFWV